MHPLPGVHSERYTPPRLTACNREDADQASSLDAEVMSNYGDQRTDATTEETSSTSRSFITNGTVITTGTTGRVTRYKVWMIVALATTSLPLAVLFASYQESSSSGAPRSSGFAVPLWLWIAFAVCIIGATVVGCLYLRARAQRENAEKIATERIAAHQQKVQESELSRLETVTPLGMLIRLNQGDLQRYHDIAIGQADRSFRSSQRAMATGLFVIFACFVAGIFLPNSQARLFVAAIAAVGSALAGFLNRTYLNMYGQTLAQLNRYFEQPVTHGYYLTAERLADQLPDKCKTENRQRIIAEVLEGCARLGGQPQSAPTQARTWWLRRAAKPQTDASAPAAQQTT